MMIKSQLRNFSVCRFLFLRR